MNCVFEILYLLTFFQLVAFILIGVAAAGKSSNLLTSLPVIGGIVACGVFLLFVAIVGILGAIKHHQVMLFFYMMVLFSIFVIQFSVACACLAVGEKEELQILEKVSDFSLVKDRRIPSYPKIRLSLLEFLFIF